MQVKIRPLEISDAKTSYKWRNNPIIWEYTGSKPNKYITYKMEFEWINEVLQRNNEKRYAIVVDGKYVGNTQFTNISSKNAEFHIFIGEVEYWGKGIATKVINLMFDKAKENNISRITLQVSKLNSRALNLYRKFFTICENSPDKTIIIMEKILC